MTTLNENPTPSPSPSPDTKTQPKTIRKKFSRGKTSAKASGPAKKPSSKLDLRDRKTEALRRLGVTKEQMVGVPRITYMLEKAEGGLEQVIEALRASDEEEAVAFIAQLDDLSDSDRNRVSLEEIATAAGIRTIDLLGTATKALFQQSQTVAAIITATGHEGVVKKSLQMALQDKGVRDREMIHTATGFLPVPKGTVILNQKTQIANFGDGGKDDEGGPAMPESDDCPEMDSDILLLQKTSRKLLEAGPVTIEAK